MLPYKGRRLFFSFFISPLPYSNPRNLLILFSDKSYQKNGRIKSIDRNAGVGNES